MKSQYFRTIIIELFLIAFSFFHFLFIKHVNQIFYTLELFLVLIVLLIINKTDKKENYQKKEVAQVIVISVLLYYILTYFSGFFIGFVYTTYSTRLMGIIRNVVTSIFFIIVMEYIRDIVIKKGRYYKSTVFLSSIIMTIIELFFVVSVSSLIDNTTKLKIILVLVFPYLFRNIFLTYCTYYFGKRNSILYHLLMAVPNYILPVFPDLGDYVSSVILLLHPLILLIYTSDSIFYKNDIIRDTYIYQKYQKISKYIYAIIIFLLLIMVYFVSDLGRFTVLAIGSESMKGTVDKGDVVFIDKKLRKYKKGEILAVNIDGTVIVHRIIAVNKDNTYVTKGDNNNGNDNWIVKEDMIKGSANFYIKYIGWPTVKLSEYLNRDD